MEQNKAKRRFNLIDAAIVLLALLVLGVIWLLRDRSTGASAAEYPMQITLELNWVRDGALELMQPGTKVYRSTDNTYLGTVAQVREEPYLVEEYSAALGRIVQYAPAEDAHRVYLTLDGSGYLTAKDVIFAGASTKIGDAAYIKGLGFAGSGYVVGVDALDAPEAGEAPGGAGKLTLTYVAVIESVRGFTADAICEGDKLYDKVTGSLLGTVKAVEKAPHVAVQLNAQGEAVEVEYPGRYDLTLTLEVPGTQKETGYWLGTAELKLGAVQQFYNRLCASSFTARAILSVEDAA